MRSPRQYAQLCASTYQPSPNWTFAGPTFHALAIDDADGGVTLAIQGSDRKFDWVADFSIYGPAWLEHPDLGLVHAAFDATTDECLPEVFRLCAGKCVRIAGHSKGGAEAEVLAAKLTVAGVEIVELVTFGTPRWVGEGNSEVYPLMAAIPGSSWRHFKDVVTQVPFYHFKHPLGRVPAEVGAGRWWQRLDWPGMHHIERYVESVPC